MRSQKSHQPILHFFVGLKDRVLIGDHQFLETVRPEDERC